VNLDPVFFVKLHSGCLVGSGGAWPLYRAQHPERYSASRASQQRPFVRRSDAMRAIKRFRLEGASVVAFRLVEVTE
jgi:hypothetical protein